MYREVNDGRCGSSKLTFYIWYLRLNTDQSIQWETFSSEADEEKQLAGEGERIECFCRTLPAIVFNSCGMWVPKAFRDADGEDTKNAKQERQAAEGSVSDAESV